MAAPGRFDRTSVKFWRYLTVAPLFSAAIVFTTTELRSIAPEEAHSYAKTATGDRAGRRRFARSRNPARPEPGVCTGSRPLLRGSRRSSTTRSRRQVVPARAPRGRQFCTTYLKLSASEANRIIREYQEFVPGFFELAQLTRISAATYRVIGAAVKDRALHFDGETIELIPENAEKVSAAVASLRKTAKRPVRQVEFAERLDSLEKRSMAIVAEFADVFRKERDSENWLRFTGVLDRVCSALGPIGLENGIL